MSETRVSEWVAKAEQDYHAAVQLSPEAVPSVICFHAQQCVEKYLKAVLVRLRLPVPKEHDLVRLLYLAVDRAPGLKGLEAKVKPLLQYAVDVRYPELPVSPSDARHARELMEHVRAQLRQFLALREEM